MNASKFYDDKKEHLITHPDLLDIKEATLGGSHPLHELTRKLLEARSKAHNHHRSVLHRS